MLSIVLLVVLLVLVLGVLPVWPHSQAWGPYPSGIGGLIVLLFVVWLLFFGGLQRLHW